MRLADFKYILKGNICHLNIQVNTTEINAECQQRTESLKQINLLSDLVFGHITIMQRNGTVRLATRQCFFIV